MDDPQALEKEIQLQRRRLLELLCEDENGAPKGRAPFAAAKSSGGPHRTR
jgi:hypothetical protein